MYSFKAEDYGDKYICTSQQNYKPDFKAQFFR